MKLTPDIYHARLLGQRSKVKIIIRTINLQLASCLINFMGILPHP